MDRIRLPLFAALALLAPLAVTGAAVAATTSIQAAVDAARPGSTVTVPAGTYVEEVVVDKDLTLLGAGVGRTIVKSPPSLTPFGVHLPDGRALTAIVRIGNGAHVRMAGFTVTGPIPCGVEVTGVQVVQGATLDLSASRVTGIQANPATCAAQDAAGRAIVYGLPAHIVSNGVSGSPAYGRVSGVTVDHYQHAGISITGPAAGPTSNVTVADSTVTGGWTIPSFQFGVDIEEGATAVVAGNRISGNVCGGPGCGPDPINQAQGTGVVLLELAGPVTVTGNQIAANDVGVYQVVSPGCCTISANRLDSNTFFGVVVLDGDGATTGNTVTGGQVGLAAVADFVDTTLTSHGDRITGTTVAATRAIDCCGARATTARLTP